MTISGTRPTACRRPAAIAAIAVTFFAPFASPPAQTRAGVAELPPTKRVRISDDGKSFVVADSGRPFVPWGFNYLGEFGKLVEETWAHDWPRLEKDFADMRALGANVVRVHLQF